MIYSPTLQRTSLVLAGCLTAFLLYAGSQDALRLLESRRRAEIDRARSTAADRGEAVRISASAEAKAADPARADAAAAPVDGWVEPELIMSARMRRILEARERSEAR